MSTYRARAGVLLLLATGLISTTVAAAEPPAASTAPIPLQAFARHVDLSDPTLSPDGKFVSVAVATDNGENHMLAIYRIADMKLYSILRLPKYELPIGTVWVGNDRIVLEKGRMIGPLDKPYATGEIITSTIDGKHQDYLYGDKPYGRRSGTRNLDYGFGSIVGLPEPRNEHFYMDARSWNDDTHSFLYDVNAHDSARHLIGDIGKPYMNFLVGADGHAAFAWGVDIHNTFVAYRHVADDRWTQLPAADTGAYWSPIRYNPAGTSIYAMWSQDRGPEKLALFNANGVFDKTLAADPHGNIGEVEWTAPPRRPFAAIPDTGMPRPIMIDPNAPEAKLYAALLRAFKGKVVHFLSYSADGRELLFSVDSDQDPGGYFLIDRTTNKVSKLFDVASWLPRDRMAHRQVARFKADDGTELEAILTLPPNRQPFKLPMVLMPHGGPIAHDSWYYDNDAQMLASRGYLVLQVNFRGSDGRGPAFYQAGYGKWGTRIQQDLIDGVKWAIREAYADPQRICVYGASFGGYSALMSTIRAPKLFKCAVGFAGVYDLDLMYNKSRFHGSAYGRSDMRMQLGDDEAAWRAQSPVNMADKVDVPVLLIHGTDDRTAPFQGAEEMRDALEKAGKPVQWMAVDHEGHGFYTVKNNVDMYQRLLAFLKQNIGPGAPVQAAAGGSQASASP